MLWWLLADTLTALDMEAPTEEPGNKTVQVVVECPLPWCYDLRLYDRAVPVPAGASLLDVLRAAAALEPHDFKCVRVTLGWPRVLPLCHGLSPVPTVQLPWGQLCPTASSAEAGPAPP